MPWPSSPSCSRDRRRDVGMRLAASAVIAPLRHPLLLAHEVGTLDLSPRAGSSSSRPSAGTTTSTRRSACRSRARRTCSTSTSPRWEGLWRDTPSRSPASTTPTRTSTSSPRPGGPTGRGRGSAASRCIPRLLEPDRPLRPRLPSARAALRATGPLRDGLAAAGRDLARARARRRHAGRIPGRHEPFRRSSRRSRRSRQLERGFTTFCIKPSQFVDDIARYPAWCREVVERIGGRADEHRRAWAARSPSSSSTTIRIRSTRGCAGRRPSASSRGRPLVRDPLGRRRVRGLASRS